MVTGRLKAVQGHFQVQEERDGKMSCFELAIGSIIDFRLRSHFRNQMVVALQNLEDHTTN